MMRYTKPGDSDDYASGHDDGGNWRNVDGAVTKVVDLNDGVFGEAVAALVKKENGHTYLTGRNQVLMTTEACWSGYSEYTVTSRWSEVVLGVVDWNWEKRYESLPEFLKALAEAVDE